MEGSSPLIITSEPAKSRPLIIPYEMFIARGAGRGQPALKVLS